MTNPPFVLSRMRVAVLMAHFPAVYAPSPFPGYRKVFCGGHLLGLAAAPG